MTLMEESVCIRLFSDDLLKRDFRSAEPLKKCVTDIAEIKAKDGKLYVSAIFDCFDAAVLGLAMGTNIKAALCNRTLANAVHSHPALRGAVIHSDRGAQHTSETYRKSIAKYGILQSMNSAGIYILVKKVSTNIDNIRFSFCIAQKSRLLFCRRPVPSPVSSWARSFKLLPVR